MLRRLLTLATDRIYSLPVMVLMPHSRCNCRCVMCDIWKANHEKRELTTEEIAKHIGAFKKLGVREVALSGGEALLHNNLWSFCDQLKETGARISLLSTGLTLAASASRVVANVNEVIVSLDGSPQVHNRIRGIPLAFEKLAEGVRALKQEDPAFKVRGRCVLQKSNFRDLPNIIAAAEDLGLDQISFLAADVSTTAFNRQDSWPSDKVSGIALNATETEEFEKIVSASFEKFSHRYRSGFIAESPRKMFELVQYYRALSGNNRFPVRRCNAPWVSAVVEADGEVRPCFFHASYGNIHDAEFIDILNSSKAVRFRKNLNMEKDQICRKCVCSLHVPLNA